MSRQYDAKQEVLKAYPTDRKSGVGMFLGYVGVSETDFAYEEGMSPEEYIYGDEKPVSVSSPAQNPPYTPGPWYWEVTRSGRNFESICAKNSDTYTAVIAVQGYAGTAWMEISDADANLIAAAPELLEALKQCRDAMHEDNPADGWLEIIEQADKAISKAKGKS